MVKTVLTSNLVYKCTLKIVTTKSNDLVQVPKIKNLVAFKLKNLILSLQTSVLPVTFTNNYDTKHA